jgi:orotidine-5'-phosphate decarboxylase
MAELVIALDHSDADTTLALARRLTGTVSWVKVGLELFTAQGPRIVGELKDLGFSVFCDLKFHDIPNTVRGAVASCVGLGADMLNVHIAGGGEMVRAAVAAARKAPVGGHSGSSPLVLGVTALTSLGPEDPLFASHPGGIAGVILDLAVNGYNNGLDGVVCSGQEVEAIKAATEAGFLCLTPGIRLETVDDDQQRVSTPEWAASRGSDYLVVGRPVTRARDPVSAAALFLERIRGA